MTLAGVPETVEWKSIRAMFLAYGAVSDGTKARPGNLAGAFVVMRAAECTDGRRRGDS